MHNDTKLSAFHHAGPTIWNSLPDELDRFHGFISFLKTILFSRY